MEMSHLVPYSKEVTATQYPRLFVDNVFWLHSMPKIIISNRDPRVHQQILHRITFPSSEWVFNSVTAFHPQMDGQSRGYHLALRRCFCNHMLNIVHLL